MTFVYLERGNCFIKKKKGKLYLSFTILWRPANVLSDANEINSSKITTLIGPKLSSL